MKVYLASSFALAQEVEKVYKALVASGHQVPDVWWHVDSKVDTWAVNLQDKEWMTHPIPRAIAQRHWGAIDSCDALVLVSQESGYKFTGANIEVGYAVGKGIPVLSVGKIERSAMYVPVIPAGNVEELLHLLNIIAVRERNSDSWAVRAV